MKYLKETNELLNLIQKKPETTQRELVDELDMSLGKINFLIRSLAEKGIIKFTRFKNSNNKRGYIYLLTPEGLRKKSEITRNFLENKIKEYELLKKQIKYLKNELGETGNRKQNGIMP